MAYKKYARTASKKIYKKAIHPYVNKKKGYANRQKLYKEIYNIKRLINVEKKRYDSTLAATSFAQFSGALTGAICTTVNPLPAQGLTGSTRTGNSIKLVSYCMDLAFNSSINTSNAVRIKYYLFYKPDNTIDTTNTQALTSLLEPNPFSAVIDYHSNRDPEYMSSFKILHTGYVSLQPDQIAGQISYAQRRHASKLSLHLKYNTDGTTTTARNKIFFACVADSGDVGALTGAQVQLNFRWFYTDN